MVEVMIASLPQSKIQNINIQNQCDNVILQADGHFAERAISNLISNALKYADSQIIISSEQTADEITISVEDDGPGVANEMREKIFDAFYRPDKSRARHQGGAGLGLAIVKRIQDWHHGHCEVESSKLGGAKFILSYPTVI
jgi:two-component system OmpR family sensor kinase